MESLGTRLHFSGSVRRKQKLNGDLKNVPIELTSAAARELRIERLMVSSGLRVMALKSAFITGLLEEFHGGLVIVIVP